MITNNNFKNIKNLLKIYMIHMLAFTISKTSYLFQTKDIPKQPWGSLILTDSQMLDIPMCVIQIFIYNKEIPGDL